MPPSPVRRGIMGNPLPRPVLSYRAARPASRCAARDAAGAIANFMLALLMDLQGSEGIYALAADTDGIDGTENNAGAMITPQSFDRARALGLKPSDYLDHNDGWGFFKRH